MVGGLFHCWGYYGAIPIPARLMGKVVIEPVLISFA